MVQLFDVTNTSKKDMQIIRIDKLREFSRFCIVGTVCTCIDSAIFYTVRTFASYSFALICGYVLSLIVNYFINIYWTFQTKPNRKNALGIFSAHLFNLFIVRMGLMYLFVNLFYINDSIAFVPTLFLSVIINFVIIELIISKVRK